MACSSSPELRAAFSRGARARDRQIISEFTTWGRVSAIEAIGKIRQPEYEAPPDAPNVQRGRNEGGVIQAVCGNCRKSPCWCEATGGGVIQTASGNAFHPLGPHPGEILIGDIAHALAMQCRFNGHVSSFYSVAQHSVYVSLHCDARDALWGLLHDASEAYIADVSRPVKALPVMVAYKQIEKALMESIAVRFGLPVTEPPSVKRADTLLVDIEARDLMSPSGMPWAWAGSAIGSCTLRIERTWPPAEAKERFLERFEELTTKAGATRAARFLLSLRKFGKRTIEALPLFAD